MSDTGTTAGDRFRALQQGLTRPPQTRRGDIMKTGGGGPRVHTPALVNLGIMDHLDRHVAEAAEVTRRLVPDAGETPQGGAIYEWMQEQTAGLDAERARVRDAMLYRHQLAHALTAGDQKVIRREPCPGCGCWALVWNAVARRAACPVRSCTDRHGRPSVWSLAQLADAAVGNTTLRKAT